MRSWTIGARAVDLGLSIDLIELLTRSLGTPACVRIMLDALNRFATVDHCALFIRSRRNDLRLLATESRISRSNAASAAVHYMTEMYRYDSGEGAASVIREGGDESVHLRYRTREEVTNARYRSACYEHVGIEDRLTMSSPYARGTETLLNCYRDERTGRFNDTELEALTQVAPLFLAFAQAHARLTIPCDISIPRWREALDHVTGAALSSRELDVCSSLLSGRTLADTSQKLGISINTVITYSRRAYAKLGVGSLGELRNRLISVDESTVVC